MFAEGNISEMDQFQMVSIVIVFVELLSASQLLAAANVYGQQLPNDISQRLSDLGELLYTRPESGLRRYLLKGE